MKKKLKVLMAAAEIAPLAKVGGLADVVGSLPPAIKKLGVDIRLILPFYGSVKNKIKAKKIKGNVSVCSGGKTEKIAIWEGKLPGTSVTIYLIENKKHFGKDEVYFGNNSERFLFFCLSIFHTLPIAKFQPDVIHCHDFHTALLINIIKATNTDYYKDIKTVYTIHNLNYQGSSETEILSTGNLTKNSLKSLTRDAQDGDINFMVQGILNADLVTTVSKTYSKEIMTSMYGAKLENIIKKRKKDLHGIINGIDVDFFNPANDKNIKKRYSPTTIKNKTVNKTYLQKTLGLPKDDNIAIVGIVTRLAWQKGIELITEKFLDLNCQFVILGTGQKKYENYLKKLAKKYPTKFSANIMFDIKLAQQIYASSDLFLMPSRFEPCGLGQMIAMRYGSVPVVRATGGLKDTVDPKVGFRFNKFETNDFYHSLNHALNVYYNKPKDFKKMQITGMKKDFSWSRSAKEYLKLYKKL